MPDHRSSPGWLGGNTVGFLKRPFRRIIDVPILVRPCSEIRLRFSEAFRARQEGVETEREMQ